MKIKGQFIQFSKIMVLVIVLAATTLTAFSIFGMIKDSDYSSLSGVMKNYTEFASVVFVAYSGNSALEKWVSKTKTLGDEDSNQNGSFNYEAIEE